MNRNSTAFPRFIMPCALAAGLLMLSGCSISVLTGKEKATKTSEFTVPIPAAGKLLIKGQNGKISCVAGDVKEISVVAHITARGATVEEAKQNLETITIDRSEADGVASIIANVPRDTSGSVTYDVTVPSDTMLDLQTSNGAVEVTGVTGNVKSVTSNGSTTLTQCSGDLDLKTSNGRITVAGDTFSKLGARTSNGAVNIKGSLAAGGHEIKTSNGSITLDLNGTPVTVTATTSNGKMTANGNKLSKGKAMTLGLDDANDSAAVAVLGLKTSNGSIHITHTGQSADE